MQRFFNGFLGPVLVSILLLLLPFMRGTFFESFVPLAFGRVHPVLVHFPIVLVCMTILLEWWPDKNRDKGDLLISVVLRFAFYSAILAVLAGICLFRSGDYGGQLVRNHLWSSIGLTIALVWSLYFKHRSHHNKQRPWSLLYQGTLLLSGLIIVLTGHLGGSLTHGTDFLTAPIDALQHKMAIQNTSAVKAPESLGIFGDLILPALKDQCGSCHNDTRSKGGLNLVSYERMMEGGKSGNPMILAKQTEQSELYRRISLPNDHDDFMPPEGKKPLDPVIVSIIQWWINSGANPADTLGEGPKNVVINTSIYEYLPTIAEKQLINQATRRDRIALEEKLKSLASRQGLHVQIDPTPDSAYYALSMNIPAEIVTDDQLRPLMKYKNMFSKVSLVSADISDEGLYYLGQMSNLKEIILAKSCLKGPGLHYLKSLQKLQVLNLSHSDIDNKNAFILTEFPQLKEVYLFNTFVDKEIVELLNSYLGDTKVTCEEGPFY